MQYFIFLLLVSFGIFLFVLFALSKDDFVLFRKNIDMEKVFNLAFLVAGIGLFFSRLFYVVLFFKPVYLNPLAFLLFPYFPGLSLRGGILGGSIALAFFLRGKKYPEGRLFDFFIFALMITLIIAELIFLGVLYGVTKQFNLVLLGEIIIIGILFLLGFRVFKNHGMKEGSIGLCMVLLLSIVYSVSLFLQRSSDLMTLYKQLSVWVIVFLLASYFFLKQESVISFLKLLGKK